MIQDQLFCVERNILLCLKKEPYDDIIHNKKKFEYRTRFFNSESKAYIYLSKHKKIVAIMKFQTPRKGNSEFVSEFAAKYDHGDVNAFLTWLNGRDCFIIPIKEVEIIEPISLQMLKEEFPDFTVPQSYYDLDRKKALLDYLNTTAKVTHKIIIDAQHNME